MEFQFLGHRQYVHGSSILDGCFQMLHFQFGNLPKHTRIVSFKMIKEFACQPRTIITRTENVRDIISVMDVVARMDINTGSDQYSVLIMPNHDQPVVSRDEHYRLEKFVRHVRLEKQAALGYLTEIKSPADVVKGTVEANKQIVLQDPNTPNHIKTKLRWGYISGFTIPTNEELQQIGSVTFTSSIYKSFGNHIFSIKQVHINGFSGEFDFTICFFLQKA